MLDLRLLLYGQLASAVRFDRHIIGPLRWQRAGKHLILWIRLCRSQYCARGFHYVLSLPTE